MALTIDQSLSMLKSSRLSDFTILCKDHVFKVHGFALYPKSRFLASCIDGGFKESEEATLTLNEQQPFVVAHMILYAYCGSLAAFGTIKTLWPDLCADEEELVAKEPRHWLLFHHIDLYEFATFLMFSELQAYAKSNILNAQRQLCDDIIEHLWHSTEPDAVEMMVKFLRHIYTRITAEEGGLRAEVTANCVKRWHEWQSCDELGVITEVVKQLEPFGLQVGLSLKALV